MKKRLKQTAQLLGLTQAFEDRERWTLRGLEDLRVKEVRALQTHSDQRRKAQQTYAEFRREGNVTSGTLAMQAEFLRWSRQRDDWYTHRIEAARSKVDEQREVFLEAMNRRKTAEKLFSQLSLHEARKESRKAERTLDEWVIQRWNKEPGG